MTKRPSEGELGRALREVDLVSYVHRLPDPKGGEGVSNWKPCDFIIWVKRSTLIAGLSVAESTWIEAKDTTAKTSFPFADIRPSQLAGIRDAGRVGIPYWLAIWWRAHNAWTISDAARILAWADEVAAVNRAEHLPALTSIPRDLLMSRFGIETKKETLVSTLKNVLLGEVD